MDESTDSLVSPSIPSASQQPPRETTTGETHWTKSDDSAIRSTAFITNALSSDSMSEELTTHAIDKPDTDWTNQESTAYVIKTSPSDSTSKESTNSVIYTPSSDNTLQASTAHVINTSPSEQHIPVSLTTQSLNITSVLPKQTADEISASSYTSEIMDESTDNPVSPSTSSASQQSPHETTTGETHWTKSGHMIISPSCRCRKRPMDLKQRIEKMKIELRINVRNTTKHRGSVSCQLDTRDSSKNIGRVGILIITLWFSVLVLFDILTYWPKIKAFIHRRGNAQD